MGNTLKRQDIFSDSGRIRDATDSQALEHVSTGAGGGEGGTPRSWASLLHINGISGENLTCIFSAMPRMNE